MPRAINPSWTLCFSIAVLLARVAAAAQIPPVQAHSPAPVILISIDTLRADHLSCLGYRKVKTSNTDAWTRGGTLFTEIESQAPITLPSHVALFTSTYPFANGIRENAQTLPPGSVTLATILAAHGYNTAAFIGGYFLERRFGLAQGFETYDSPFDNRAIKGALDLKRPAAQVIESAERWLDKNSDHPFFLFVHLFDLHEPYDAPAAYRLRAPQSEYNQALAYVDDQLGEFRAYLAKYGLDQKALVVIFSDHGESLGDHGENTHGYFVYQSTLHVPLIFHWPGRDEIGDSTFKIQDPSRGSSPSPQTSSIAEYKARIDAPAGLIDVAPTILGYLGIPLPATFSGHSLLNLVKGDTSADRDVYSESSYAHDMFGWARLRSLRRGDFQFIDTPKPELYDLKNDPAERRNLLPGQTALAASYREKLSAVVAEYPAAPGEPSEKPTAPPASSAEELKTLGYLEITSSKPALEDAGVDPKDRLFEYKRYLLAGHLARIGKADEAVAEFEAILNEDPRNVPAYLDLALSEIGLHNYLIAANRLKSALALDPHNVEGEELLGDVWLTVGNPGRAAAEFNRLLKFAPEDYEAHYGLGLVARGHSKYPEAEKDFRAAMTSNPDSAEAHYQLGMVLEAQDRKQEAAQEFRKALAIDPNYNPARREIGKLAATLY